jgi:hypothetical protein
MAVGVFSNILTIILTNQKNGLDFLTISPSNRSKLEYKHMEHVIKTVVVMVFALLVNVFATLISTELIAQTVSMSIIMNVAIFALSIKELVVLYQP